MLEMKEGKVGQSNAIANLIAAQCNADFLGKDSYERVQVNQWTDFASFELFKNTHSVVYPLLGWGEHSHDHDAGLNEIKNHLRLINTYLGTNRKHFVGNHWTYADVDIFFTLRHFFQLVFVENFRTQVFPNVTRWFNDIANHENIVKVCGRTQLCKVPQKPPKLGKDIHEAPKKKDAKKEEPKKKEETGGEEGGDGDEEKPVKKAKDPLELLPETPFDLDSFKREFMNSKDRKSTMEELWKKFDSKGWSFWWMQYQNLPSEGKILFKTNNSASIFLQNLDSFRKWSFGSYGVYGVEGDYVCRGIFMWRGLEIPNQVKEHNNYEYMDIKNLDWEKDRAYIENYWLNLEEGNDCDGRKVASVWTFK